MLRWVLDYNPREFGEAADSIEKCVPVDHPHTILELRVISRVVQIHDDVCGVMDVAYVILALGCDTHEVEMAGLPLKRQSGV